MPDTSVGGANPDPSSQRSHQWSLADQVHAYSGRSIGQGGLISSVISSVSSYLPMALSRVHGYTIVDVFARAAQKARPALSTDLLRAR